MSNPILNRILGLDIDWILEYLKMLESVCPPEWDAHTRNFMLMTAPAVAVRNKYVPMIEEQAEEIERLKAKVKKLEEKLALANLNGVTDILAWMEAEKADNLKEFGAERARDRNAAVSDPMAAPASEDTTTPPSAPLPAQVDAGQARRGRPPINRANT